MEEYLHGQDGFRFIEHNRLARNRALSWQERPAARRLSVHLTIDLKSAEPLLRTRSTLRWGVFSSKSDDYSDRPRTGEILAMANRPDFDLNLRAEAKPEEMKNRAVIDMMEPGSTFKIVAAPLLSTNASCGPIRRSFARTVSGISAAQPCTIIAHFRI